MLRKLFRYENRYYAKIMSLCYLILAGTLIVGRLVSELYDYLDEVLPDDSAFLILNSIPLSLMHTFIAAALFGVLIVPQILLAVRFWKNLIRDGGYLSLTLPVKPQAHVACKIITAFVWTLISAVVDVILYAASQLIFDSEATENAVDIINGIGDSEIVTKDSFTFLLVSLIVSGILLALVTAVRTAFSMSMGQLTRRNKLLVAIGCWFGTGVLWDILSSMAYVVALVPVIASVDDECEALDLAATGMPFFLGNAAISLMFIIAGWCVSNYIFKHKINLE